ncbi:hypothetical protein KR100_01520 [Synechococcus sp. KORDI-100]|uniref:peptidylprolyl isomerase n=1 Tax=Synechococcus sp. KORDI-100 TaxID=1280380 RepID=UPI0004E037A8|nr:peptidylprolyl isomerase [Synechococcus sp. KORDI-100]AII42086.1 hypothetical protein KR100_01520 [Synechococcus sp. KORDI-100]
MSFNHELTDQRIIKLVSRLGLASSLYRCLVEEEIVKLVSLDEDWIDHQLPSFLGEMDLTTFLRTNRLTQEDLLFKVKRDESLRRFSHYQFGSGLEDYFLRDKELRDQVVYSLIRVSDPGLVREIWIRLEEGEMTFQQASSAFGEGPEARHQGLYGPMAVGALQPIELATIVRNLKPGEIMKPRQLGDWHLIIRLEQLHPARLDDAMVNTLLNEQLEALLQSRVTRLLAGETLEPLSYE